MKQSFVLAVSIVAFVSSSSVGESIDSISNTTALRRPIDLEFDQANRQLLVLNQEAGTVSIVSADGFRILGEHRVGQRPSSFCLYRDQLTVVDEQANSLSRFSVRVNELQKIDETSVSSSPVDVQISTDGQFAFVTSLWAHRWTCFEIQSSAFIERSAIDLDFAPRHQCQISQTKVLVTDAFGGQWAVIDLASQKIFKFGEFEATHNISDLAIGRDNESLFIPHVTLNPEKPTTQFNVHWGDIMLNVVRRVSLDQLLDLDTKQLDDRVHYLGRPDSATGDPMGMVITDDGRQIVCYAGISQIGMSDDSVNSFSQVNVGRHPVSLALNHDQSIVFVANRLDDSVTVIDVGTSKKIGEINLGSTVQLTLAQQGELLFYDSTLSSDGWFSCHTCHTNGHSNGGLADTFGDGKPGDAKRILSLLGAYETGPWAWSGKVETLHEQVAKSVETTMRGPGIDEKQVDALVAFLKTLKAPPSVGQARLTHDSMETNRGREVFRREGCVDCHVPEVYTSPDAYDVGVVDQLGNDHFNPPSLRGLSHRRRLFHDNRATSVRDVIVRFQHQLTAKLSEQDERDLMVFLQSL